MTQSLTEEGVLLVDKPEGISSFDVIRRLRKELGIFKMGHAGTLDPRATGLLIVAVGTATKKLKDYIGLPKTYRAEILLGVKTATADLEGEIIEEKPIAGIDEEKIRKILSEMRGGLNLKVPLYSAIKRGGKALYAYAREGISIEPPEKEMFVIGSDFISFDGKVIAAEFNVKSGTYIRSLAEEIGKRLGTVATLKSLRRLTIGNFSVKNARKIES